MNRAITPAILSALRWAMAVGGAYVVTKGLMTQESFDQLLGALVVIVPLVWGALQKFAAERAAKKRETVAVAVGMTIADATVGPTPLIPPIRVPEVIASIAPRIILPADKAAPPVVVLETPRG
jgi:hypothetical protein